MLSRLIGGRSHPSRSGRICPVTGSHDVDGTWKELFGRNLRLIIMSIIPKGMAGPSRFLFRLEESYVGSSCLSSPGSVSPTLSVCQGRCAIYFTFSIFIFIFPFFLIFTFHSRFLGEGSPCVNSGSTSHQQGVQLVLKILAREHDDTWRVGTLYVVPLPRSIDSFECRFFFFSAS